jgi:hypothetical protein
MGADRERLDDSCGQPCWRVTRDEYYAEHCFNTLGESGIPFTWKLQVGNSTDQTEQTTLVQYISQRRKGGGQPLISHPRPTRQLVYMLNCLKVA